MKGYRKFSLAVGVILISTGLLIFGLITAGNFESLAKWVTGLYLSANFASAVGTKLAEKSNIEVVVEPKK